MADDEQRREYQRVWHNRYYHANRERLLEWQKEYERKHTDRKKTYDRSYFVANKAQRHAQHRTWQLGNPERIALLGARRRANMRKASGSHTTAEWLDKFALLGNVCLYCGEAKPLTRDHKVPLSRGGSNAIENIVPACQPCNSAKTYRTTKEFLLDGRC